ncbi:MAG: 2-oxo acid dehydrogenase subunit E2, partial [Verrucomicrobiales bacterium]|nr:2-oxo acid dehydrogenase subunit E2 [Verrucomicrobiales bacterium]
MPKIIEMPKLSDTMTEGTLAKWLIQEGEKVVSGQTLADVETDKATMEMTSFFDGTVLRLLVKPGEKIPLGSPMAVVLEEDEEAPADLDGFIATAKAAAVAAAHEEANSAAPSGATARRASGPSTLLPRAPGRRRRSAANASAARVKASPLARKIADELGVDLTRLEGTGPGGRIVRGDVEAAPNHPASAAGLTRSAAPAIRPTAGPEDQRLPVSSMRNIIAERLLASKTQIPHFYLQMEVDAAPMMDFRKTLNAQAERTGEGNKYTVNDFILKAAVNAVAAVPTVNAAWDGDSIVQYRSVGLSVAIAVDDGLVTPVIKQAEQKTMLQLSEMVKDLASRARAKKLTPDEFSGGTITISNLGAYGVDQFAAIINPPQALILSVGSIRKAPVVTDRGEVGVG